MALRDTLHRVAVQSIPTILGAGVSAWPWPGGAGHLLARDCRPAPARRLRSSCVCWSGRSRRSWSGLIILGRVGTGILIDLGEARPRGWLRQLERQGIDPVALLVMPRVVGFAIGAFCLGTLLLVSTLVSGYLAGAALGLITVPIWQFGQNVLLGDGYRRFRHSAGQMRGNRHGRRSRLLRRRRWRAPTKATSYSTSCSAASYGRRSPSWSSTARSTWWAEMASPNASVLSLHGVSLEGRNAGALDFDLAHREVALVELGDESDAAGFIDICLGLVEPLRGEVYCLGRPWRGQSYREMLAQRSLIGTLVGAQVWPAYVSVAEVVFDAPALSHRPARGGRGRRGHAARAALRPGRATGRRARIGAVGRSRASCLRARLSGRAGVRVDRRPLGRSHGRTRRSPGAGDRRGTGPRRRGVVADELDRGTGRTLRGRRPRAAPRRSRLAPVQRRA